MTRVNREGPVQRAIVDYLRLALPGAIVHHSKSEINKRGASIARELFQAKLSGVVTGFPDLIVVSPAPAPVMFFEVKAPGNYPSPAQRAVHARLEALGQRIAVVRSVDDVVEAIERWKTIAV